VPLVTWDRARLSELAREIRFIGRELWHWIIVRVLVLLVVVCLVVAKRKKRKTRSS